MACITGRIKRPDGSPGAFRDLKWRIHEDAEITYHKNYGGKRVGSGRKRKKDSLY